MIDPEKLTDIQDMQEAMMPPDSMEDPKECYHCHAWFDAEKALDKESESVCEGCYVGK